MAYLWGILEKHCDDEFGVKVRVIDGKNSYWQGFPHVRKCIDGSTMDLRPFEEEILQMEKEMYERYSTSLDRKRLPYYYLIIDEFLELSREAFNQMDNKEAESLLGSLGKIVNLGMECRCFVVFISQSYQVNSLRLNTKEDRNRIYWVGLGKGDSIDVIENMANDSNLTPRTNQNSLKRGIRGAKGKNSPSPIAIVPRTGEAERLPDLSWSSEIDLSKYRDCLIEGKDRSYIKDLEANRSQQLQSSKGDSDRDLHTEKLNNCEGQEDDRKQPETAFGMNTPEELQELFNRNDGLPPDAQTIYTYLCKKNKPLKPRDVQAAKLSISDNTTPTINSVFRLLEEWELGKVHDDGSFSLFSE